jgi:hypothetical protein
MLARMAISPEPAQGMNLVTEPIRLFFGLVPHPEC